MTYAIIRRSIQNLNGPQPLTFPHPTKGAVNVLHVKLHFRFSYGITEDFELDGQRVYSFQMCFNGKTETS